MIEKFEQVVYVKVYTTCSICLGKGEFEFSFLPKKCRNCLGTGKKESLITIEDFKKLLDSVKL